MKYILRQVLPPDMHEEPIEIHLTEDEVQVGRKSKIMLAKFPQISRHHATFYKSDNGTLFVKDQGSLNGLFVNDEKIGTSLKSLKIGDVLGFGVMCDQVNVGFVCVVSCDTPPCKIKQEVIEISDDDDDLSNNAPTSSEKPDPSQVTNLIKESTNSIKLPNATLSNNFNSHVSCIGNNIQNNSFQPSTSKINENPDFPSSRSKCNPSTSVSSVLNELTVQGSPAISRLSQESKQGKNKPPKLVSLHFSKNSSQETCLPKCFDVPSDNMDTDTFKQGAASCHKPNHSTPKDQKEYGSKIPERLSSDDISFENCAISNNIQNKTLENACTSKSDNLFVPKNIQNKNGLSNVSSKSSSKDASFRVSSISDINMLSVNDKQNNPRQDIINHRISNVSSKGDSKKGNSSRISDVTSIQLNSTEINCPVMPGPCSVKSGNDEPSFKSGSTNSGMNIFNQKVRENSCKSSSSNATDHKIHPLTNSDSLQNSLDSKLQKSDEEGRKLLKSLDVSHPHQTSSKTLVSKKIKTGCTSDFQNDSPHLSTGYGDSKKTEPTRTCFIPLIRCDSKYFPWPEGIKNPFLKKYNSSFDRVPEHVSQSSHAGLLKNTNSSNISTDSYNNNTKYSNLPKQDGKYKRKSSCESNVEVPDNIPSTSKRFCFENEYKKRTASDDHETSLSKNILKSESESDNEMNYSQVEDVIYISDDEEDLNLKSQQNYFHIKNEPIDDYEDDIYILDDIESASSSNVFSNSVHIKQEKNIEVETAQSISAFVSNNEQKLVKQCVDVSAKNTNIKEIANEPVLPQNFEIDREEEGDSSEEDADDSEEDADNSEEDIDNKEGDINNKLKPYEGNLCPKQNNKKSSEYCSVPYKNYEKFEIGHQSMDNINRPIGKIQLIDAKPLEYRPRNKRGRDEGFVERKKLATTTPKKNKGSPKKALLKKKVSFFTDPNLNNFKIPRKQNSNTINSSVQKERSYQPPKENSSFRKYHESAKKSSSVKTRPEKTTSRMGFLFSEVKINPRSRAVTNLETSKRVEEVRRTNKGLNSSANSSRGSEFPKKKAQQSQTVSKSHKAEAASIKTPVYNPRDPRQNRIQNRSASSEISNQNSAAAKTPTDGKSVHPKIVSSNKASPTVVPNVCSNADTHELRSKLIDDLIHLNTKWLEEQNKVKHPPEAVSAGADKLPLKFESYESYVSLLYPMIRLEIWEQMYAESKEVYASQKKYRKFLFSILSYSSRNNHIELQCEAAVNEKFNFIPCEGSITLLDLRDNSKRICPMFGYISKHKFEILNWNSFKLPPNVWKSSLPEEFHRNAKHLTFYALIKKKEISFALESLMKGNGLCYIRNKLRLVDTLTSLKHSPLLGDILQPKWQTFLVKYSTASPTREYNSGQMEVINSVSAEISRSPNKIILIQGPPGTGKTHTIIGLIHRLLSAQQYNLSCKILVAAPSNAAIDEIGCRLIDFNERNKSKASIKFVRVGMEDQMHVKMKPYSLDRIAKNNSISKEKEREIKNLRAEIARVEKDVYNKDRNETLKYLQDTLKHLTEYAKPFDYSSDFMQKMNLLRNSQIVLSTLSCCGLPLLLKTFNTSDVQFSCCIVDESTQCTELEVFQPLLLKVKKLILVGDHKQLPATVLSKTACKYGFERSAFERFHTYFVHSLKKTPIYTLTEQFRMHSEICKFPSKYIYDHKLITNPNTDISYKDFPLLPYMMLNLFISQEENDSSSKINSTEAKVIINICTVLLDIVDSASSIGIITPYQAQRLLYINNLHKHPRYKDIEVNTVDGFQGREKDIIIVSSVRANENCYIGFLACKRRLNVAITRAKKCLIVCGHTDSLIKNHDWRELIKDAKQRDVYFDVNTPGDIYFLFKHKMRKQRGRH